MSTWERVIEVYITVFEDADLAATLTPDSTLREEAGINSIGMLYMAMALEEAFSVKFQNEDLKDLVTIGDVVRCIDGKL